MTEREKTCGRFFVVAILIAMFTLSAGALIWAELNKPMGPVVEDNPDRIEVRWGRRIDLWTNTGYLYMLVYGKNSNGEILILPDGREYIIEGNDIWERIPVPANDVGPGFEVKWFQTLPPEIKQLMDKGRAAANAAAERSSAAFFFKFFNLSLKIILYFNNRSPKIKMSGLSAKQFTPDF